MMEALTILGSIIGSGAVSGIIAKVIFRKQERKLKDNEVESSVLDNEAKRLENDLKQIDVGTLYLEKTQHWADIMAKSANSIIASNEKRDKDWDELKRDIEHLKADIKEIRREQTLQGEFLNGEFKQYKIEHER